ncbi:MAG: type I glutamate--ammonia ligase [Desulfurococcaceae archaeon]
MLIRKVEDSGVDWVHFQFTDLSGYLRHITMPAKILSNGIAVKLDGSSVKGFTGVEESDLVLRPVPETFAKVPWQNRAGRLICAVYLGGERFSRDPRYTAEKLDKLLADTGLRLFVSAELEYFLFDKVTVVLDAWKQSLEFTSSEAHWSCTAPFNRLKEGYYAPYPKDRFEDFKIEVAEMLEKSFGVVIEAIHHEVAGSSQHEVIFRGGSATYLGDSVQTVKYVIKALAHKKGYVASFMPKPIHGDNGCGMHVHVSLWHGERNIFYDPSDTYRLSQEARYFIGGLLEHARALAALTNPTVNSYKRLVPGYEAPVYLVWGKGNRSAAIRIPGYAVTENSTRIEYRPPDPGANPYIAVPAIVLAGLDGVKKKIDPGDPVEENVYKMPKSKRKELGIRELPRSLDEALDELECDNEWLKPVFVDELLEAYIELKREESRRISSYPTPSEVFYYIDV